MNKKECEEKIMKKLIEIFNIYRRYYENGEFFNATFVGAAKKNECVLHINNQYYGDDHAYPINRWVKINSVNGNIEDF